MFSKRSEHKPKYSHSGRLVIKVIIKIKEFFMKAKLNKENE